MKIYCIRNTVNNKVYIGQTTAKFVSNRWSHHKWKLKRGIHDNAHLQNSWNKYEKSSFLFSIVAEASSLDELNSLEEYWIGQYDSKNPSKGYNKLSGGMNKYHSDDTKRKMSESQRSRKRTPRDEATKKKLSEALKGRKISEAHRAAIGKGSKQSWANASIERRRIAAKSALENIHGIVINE